MAPKSKQPRRESSAQPHDLPDDLRREDQATIAPENVPDSDDEAAEDEPAEAHEPAEDGGNDDHPIHDDDPSDDFTSRDYEEQIEEVAQSRRVQRKRTDVEEP